jgi:hypothetical protein
MLTSRSATSTRLPSAAGDAADADELVTGVFMSA